MSSRWSTSIGKAQKIGQHSYHDHNPAAYPLQYFHDFRLVRPFEVPTHPAFQSNHCQLAYCFQVPANRIGSYEFSTAQLKTIQEVITLSVFSVFSVLYLKEPLKWNYLAGFAMIIVAVFVIFKKW